MSATRPACLDCRGRGWRIITQDGTRPSCITCSGTGFSSRLPMPDASRPVPETAGREARHAVQR